MKKYNGFIMKDIINHLKETGFIFQGSELYGGLANSWDYGPLGVMLKNKLKKAWWDFFIKNNEYNVGLDSSILLNPKVWQASGHLENFNDPLIDCKECKSRFRADNLIHHYFPETKCDGWENKKLEDFISEKKIKCLKCQKSNFTKIRQFHLMFETRQGTIEEQGNKLYLRPETAQGIFINFNNIKRAYNKKLPFGIGQIGKSFRNEITPGNFIFRTFEFEQMELEFFYAPSDKTDWFNYWVKEVEKFVTNLGLLKEDYHLKAHSKDELSHYSTATTDIEYNFPFGWKELCGIAHRGDFDLTQHAKFSGQKITIEDPVTKKQVVPYVIEPSMGVERLILAIICQSLKKEKLEDKERIVLKLTPNLAPYHAVITSINKNKLGAKAKEIFALLQKTKLDVTYEEKSSVGKVYNYHDSIGTLYCITVDYETEKDNMITVRDRNTTEQKRIKITELQEFLQGKIN